MYVCMYVKEPLSYIFQKLKLNLMTLFVKLSSEYKLTLKMLSLNKIHI